MTSEAESAHHLSHYTPFGSRTIRRPFAGLADLLGCLHHLAHSVVYTARRWCAVSPQAAGGNSSASSRRRTACWLVSGGWRSSCEGCCRPPSPSPWGCSLQRSRPVRV